MRKILIALAAALFLAGCATGYGYNSHDRYGYGDYYYGSASAYGAYGDYYEPYGYAGYGRGGHAYGGLGYYRGLGYYGGWSGLYGYPWYGGSHYWYGLSLIHI